MYPASDLLQEFRFINFKSIKMSPIVVYFNKKKKPQLKELVEINSF